MGPVQYVYLAIAVVIALIGLARGYDKELGNSIILMITIALLGFIESRYEPQIIALSGRILGVNSISTFLFLLYSLTFVAVVFSSYSGITLNYGGTPWKGFGGQMLSLFVGLFNGYLIAGTLWHYANKFGYPLTGVTQLDPNQVQALGLLPQTIFPDTLFWVVPAAILLIMRVRG
jgi:hypothetical protein